jgi:hypothetical protein
MMMVSSLPIEVLGKSGDPEWSVRSDENEKVSGLSSPSKNLEKVEKKEKPRFRFANYNVLLLNTFYHKLLLNSPKRYNYIVNKILPTLNADVIAFNESNPFFEATLKQGVKTTTKINRFAEREGGGEEKRQSQKPSW